MRFILILVFVAAVPLFADQFQWDDLIFPPDPYRTVEEKKMKPMVFHGELYAMSGSNSLTSTYAVDRSSWAVYPDQVSAGWESRLLALEKVEGKDYKDR